MLRYADFSVKELFRAKVLDGVDAGARLIKGLSQRYRDTSMELGKGFTL